MTDKTGVDGIDSKDILFGLRLTTNISLKCLIASSFFLRAMEYVIKTLENIVIVRRKI